MVNVGNDAEVSGVFEFDFIKLGFCNSSVICRCKTSWYMGNARRAAL